MGCEQPFGKQHPRHTSSCFRHGNPSQERDVSPVLRSPGSRLVGMSWELCPASPAAPPPDIHCTCSGEGAAIREDMYSVSSWLSQPPWTHWWAFPWSCFPATLISNQQLTLQCSRVPGDTGHRCIASFEKELAGWGRGVLFQVLPGFLDSHLWGYS